MDHQLVLLIRMNDARLGDLLLLEGLVAIKLGTVVEEIRLRRRALQSADLVFGEH